jgi:predicted metal-binding protein
MGEGERMEKYIQLAKEHKMIHARMISPQEISFDIRAILKCRWGCEYSVPENIRCHTRNTSYQERVEMERKMKVDFGEKNDLKFSIDTARFIL